MVCLQDECCGGCLKSVKCYPGGWKIYLTQSISEILSQKWYRSPQYRMCQLLSFIPHTQHDFCPSWLIWACYLSLWWPALPSVQAILRINNMLKWANSVGNDASKVVIGSYDGAWCTQHNGTNFLTVSQILMEWDQFFAHQDNIETL